MRGFLLDRDAAAVAAQPIAAVAGDDLVMDGRQRVSVNNPVGSA
jgi:hypothetical protein